MSLDHSNLPIHFLSAVKLGDFNARAAAIHEFSFRARSYRILFPPSDLDAKLSLPIREFLLLHDPLDLGQGRDHYVVQGEVDLGCDEQLTQIRVAFRQGRKLRLQGLDRHVVDAREHVEERLVVEAVVLTLEAGGGPVTGTGKAVGRSMVLDRSRLGSWQHG